LIELFLAAGKVVWQGQVGKDLALEEGRSTAELAALNVLAAAASGHRWGIRSVRGRAGSQGR